MNHDGYSTSYLRSLLVRLEKASHGFLRFSDRDKQASFDIAVFARGFWEQDEPAKKEWHALTCSSVHSRHRRYISILNALIGEFSDDNKSFLDLRKMFGFGFGSVEELELALSARGL